MHRTAAIIAVDSEAVVAVPIATVIAVGCCVENSVADKGTKHYIITDVRCCGIVLANMAVAAAVASWFEDKKLLPEWEVVVDRNVLFITSVAVGVNGCCAATVSTISQGN